MGRLVTGALWMRGGRGVSGGRALKRVFILGCLCLASCGSSQRDAETKAIADLERRVAALEKPGVDKPSFRPTQGYELVAPELGGQRRFYLTEAKCYEARSQILAEGANRAATMRGGSPYGRYAVVDSPFASCIPI
jgi:hypothetical protein